MELYNFMKSGNLYGDAVISHWQFLSKSYQSLTFCDKKGISYTIFRSLDLR